MLELIKRRIHMNRRRRSITSQLTLDDDFNVPDSMDDVAQLIMDSGDVQIESVRNLGEKAAVKGNVGFRVLYRTPDGQIQTLAGVIPFDETINLPEGKEEDELRVSYDLDDLNAGMIHSRKLNVKALVTLHIQAEAIEDADAAIEAAFDGSVETLKTVVDVAVPSVRRKDTFRVKERLTLPMNRPDINKILWQEVKLRNISTKLLDRRVHLDGEVMLFLVYSGEEDRIPIQWMEESIAFSGDVELPEAREEMIPCISVKLLHKDVEINPDADGEMREIQVDAVMELDMRLFEEERIELLRDLYALDREVHVEMEQVCFDQIHARNSLKHRIQEKVILPGNQRILQICHSDGSVKIDDAELREDGLHVDGVLEVKVLFLTSDDAKPMDAFTELLPFHVVAEMPGNRTVSGYRMEPGLEQISAVMLGQDTVEVKAVVTLDILVFGENCQSVITQVREEPVDVGMLKKMPGIVGYVVQPGDSLWKIAREFHTSVDEIMAANRLTDSGIRPGDKLILIKTVREQM